MSRLRISSGRPPTPPAQPAGVQKQNGASVESAQVQAPASAKKTNAVAAIKETFVSSLSSLRRPPPMPLGGQRGEGPTTAELFPEELEDLETRSTEEVSGDLAMLYLNFFPLAQEEADGDLTAAFEQMGELMREYEHIRMLKTGELG